MWRLDGNLASFETAGLSGVLDLERPSLGCRDIRLHDCEIVGANLFRFQFENSPVGSRAILTDRYIRAADLIVAYKHSLSWPVHPQMDWRTLHGPHEGQAVGVELILSVQTSRLDSEPEVTLTTYIPATEVLQLIDLDQARFVTLNLTSPSDIQLNRVGSAPLSLCRLPRGQWSYAEFIHPADYVSGKLARPSTTAPVVRLTHYIFRESLEKGVIRRGRIRGVFLSRERDELLATECYRQLISAAPPLTA